ncbi:hypothetical protein Q97_03347 [Enterococcus faecalis EnGen0061]|uniref:BRCT domain-containing protein n=2 Tax=Enterococcus faecalis TaxID=1351 RepID=UPI00032F5F0C|nr:BRCT domain-containing protein [Enterococcus faecalis]EOK46936.1 hypothetical protein Q97_03347 [Enterococcus faecalis EnGen0061]
MDLTNQRVVFTGTLQQMTRTQAIDLVHSLNGHCQSSVTSKTNFLVCGQYSKSLFDDSLYTIKEQTAMDLIALGHEITILSEVEFYALISQQLKEWRFCCKVLNKE